MPELIKYYLYKNNIYIYIYWWKKIILFSYMKLPGYLICNLVQKTSFFHNPEQMSFFSERNKLDQMRRKMRFLVSISHINGI